MNKTIKRTLAAALAVGLIFASGTYALADPGGNGHGQGKAHANQAKGPAKAHVESVRANDNDNDNDNNKNEHGSKGRGNSLTAHSCINPAGNQRGWCKEHMNGAFINGTVTGINGNTALVTLANGQEVQVSNAGRKLSVGQIVTLRGNFGANSVFVPTGGNYSKFGGPFSGASVRGLVVSVSGNSVQIVQGLSLITIDASNAIARGTINGTLLPGRTITANGNWNGSTFVANSIQ
jgi:hypothetical protein